MARPNHSCCPGESAQVVISFSELHSLRRLSFGLENRYTIVKVDGATQVT